LRFVPGEPLHLQHYVILGQVLIVDRLLSEEGRNELLISDQSVFLLVHQRYRFQLAKMAENLRAKLAKPSETYVFDVLLRESEIGLSNCGRCAHGVELLGARHSGIRLDRLDVESQGGLLRRQIVFRQNVLNSLILFG